METSALPIEPLAYMWVGINPHPYKLLGLAVLRVLAATRTILVEFQPIGIVAAILLGDVIALLAFIAL